ncbi:hypothetical protein [Aggregatibacter actinomycetemcomitans]|uniref:hypothetical protein n=1 Tax=Aggregatibacter actinomycetemcomitans TaxID=714 RepID=UPI0039EF47A9
MQKYDTQNHLQRYKCPHCNKVFSFKSKLNPIQIWEDYKNYSLVRACNVILIKRLKPR